MKKNILSVIIVISFALTTKAQTGSILVYGNVGITSTKFTTFGNNATMTSSNINPGIGYQFNNAWTAGLNLGYVNNNSTYTEQTFSVGPFIRYAKTLSPIFSIYGQFQVGYNHSTYSNSAGPSSNGFETDLFPAIFINIKNGFGLNFDIGGIDYSTTSEKGISGSVSYFNLTFGRAINIGISKNFGGKSHS